MQTTLIQLSGSQRKEETKERREERQMVGARKIEGRLTNKNRFGGIKYPGKRNLREKKKGCFNSRCSKYINHDRGDRRTFK